MTAPRTLHLLYHEVAPAPGPYSYTVSCDTLDGHLALLGQLTPGSSEPRITFDDGHRSVNDPAQPLRERHRMHAHLFITAGWTGRRAGYLDWPELRALHHAGHTVGAHGWSHALLTRCADAQLQTELRDPKLLLEDRLGTPVTTLSFPGGRFNHRVLQACQEAGYTQLFTSIPRAESQPPGQLIGRVNIRQSVSAAYVASLLQHRSPALRRLYLEDRIKTAAKRLLGNDLYASLWARLNHQAADAEEPAA